MDIILKQKVNYLFDICDKLEELFTEMQITEALKKCSLKKYCNGELLSFIVFLTEYNNNLKKKVIECINFYLDWNFQSTDGKNIIKISKDITGNIIKMCAEGLIIIRSFVFVENTIFDRNSSTDVKLVEIYLDVLQSLGYEIFSYCGISDKTRISKANTFITCIKNYIKNNHRYIWNVSNIDQAVFTTYWKPNSITLSETNNKANNFISQNNITKNKKTLIVTLDDLMDQLNSLIGLDTVKNDVISLINWIKINNIRKKRGLNVFPISLHMVFYGNPGTGKTTVARLLSKIYKQLGVLSKGHLTEVDRSNLVGGYIGQTALKTQDVIEKSMGGILFIDEAYSLANRGDNDYGIEAIDTLVKAMEDHRNDLVIIVAGYPDLMNGFLNSNPGLRSRFNKFIFFPDYSPTEMIEIFNTMVTKAGYKTTKMTSLCAKNYFERQFKNKNTTFANARGVRNFFEKAVANQANRLACKSENISDEALITIEFEDVSSIK